jgi:hypothetical protein
MQRSKPKVAGASTISSCLLKSEATSMINRYLMARHEIMLDSQPIMLMHGSMW